MSKESRLLSVGASPVETVYSLGAWQKRSLSHLLQETNTFVTCVELVTSRGVITERNGRRVLELARGLAQHPHVQAQENTG